MGLAAFAAMSCLAWGLAASALAASEPIIESESVSHLTSTGATLEAQIATEGVEHGAYYQFQIARNPGEYTSGILCPSTLQQGTDGCLGPQSPGAPPIGFVPGGKASPVSLDLASTATTIQPGTTYHYRVIVARAVHAEDTIQWEAPIAYGPDQTFTTPPLAQPDEVQTGPAEATPNGFKLKGKLNPEGLPTTYYFVYKDSGVECEDMLGCGPETIRGGPLTGDTQQEVPPIEVTGLDPGQTYTYWLIAFNAKGIVAGRQLRFTTPPAGAVPAIDSVSLSHLTATDATLEAQINTEGQATIYEFLMWYEPCAICEDLARFEIHLPSGLLLGSYVDQSVSLDLNSVGVTLRPGAAYSYSLRATNVAGSPEAQWQTFEPPAGETEPLDPGVSRPPSGGQLAPFDNSGQSAGSATNAIPALQSLSSPGASKTSPAKPAAQHKPRRTKAARHRAGQPRTSGKGPDRLPVARKHNPSTDDLSFGSWPLRHHASQALAERRVQVAPGKFVRNLRRRHYAEY